MKIAGTKDLLHTIHRLRAVPVCRELNTTSLTNIDYTVIPFTLWSSWHMPIPSELLYPFTTPSFNTGPVC